MKVKFGCCWLLVCAGLTIGLGGCCRSNDAGKSSAETATTTNIVADPAPTKAPPAPSAADKLVDEYTKSQTYKEKEAALLALRRLNSDEALMALATLFSIETDDDLRVDILDTMSRIKSPNTAWAIIPALDPAYVSDVRLAAIEALEDADQTNAIPPLQALLTDPNPAIRKAAAHAIDWIMTPRASPEQLKELFRRLQLRKEKQQKQSGG